LSNVSEVSTALVTLHTDMFLLFDDDDDSRVSYERDL
jgi:hypothetical protein